MKILFYGFSSILNLIILIFLIIIRIEDISQFFLYLTILNFTSCTLYLTLRFYSELLLHINNGNHIEQSNIKKSKFYKLIKNKISKFIFSICSTVCFAFWVMCLGGESIMIFPTKSAFEIFMGVYLHFVIGIFIIIENLISDIKPNQDEYFKDFSICAIGLISYSIVLTILAKNIEYYEIYPFLKLDLMKIFSIYIILYLILNHSYNLYHFIHDRKNSNNEVILDDVATKFMEG